MLLNDNNLQRYCRKKHFPHVSSAEYTHTQALSRAINDKQLTPQDIDPLTMGSLLQNVKEITSDKIQAH
jgi:hypothetical protein